LGVHTILNAVRTNACATTDTESHKRTPKNCAYPNYPNRVITLRR